MELAELRVRLGYGYTVKLNLKLSSQDPYLSKAMPNTTFPARVFRKQTAELQGLVCSMLASLFKLLSHVQHYVSNYPVKTGDRLPFLFK